MKGRVSGVSRKFLRPGMGPRYGATPLRGLCLEFCKAKLQGDMGVSPFAGIVRPFCLRRPIPALIRRATNCSMGKTGACAPAGNTRILPANSWGSKLRVLQDGQEFVQPGGVGEHAVVKGVAFDVDRKSSASLGRQRIGV